MIRTLNRLQPWALLFIRLVVGICMVVASYSKIIPTSLHGNLLAPMQHFNQFVATLGLPPWLGYISTTTEFFGGIFLILGFLTRLSAFFITINMVVALATVNIKHGYAGSQYSIALIVMSFMLLTAGSGTLSLDRRLGLS